MFDRRRILTSCVVVLMLLALANAVGLFARPEAQAQDATVLLDPSEGMPGDVVVVSGEGFNRDTRGKVIWTTSGKTLGTFKTRDNGTFEEHIRIPDAEAGHHTLDVVVGDVTVQAELHVRGSSPPTEVSRDASTDEPTDEPSHTAVSEPTQTSTTPAAATNQLTTQTPTSGSGGGATLAAAGDVACTSSGTSSCAQALTGDLVRQLSPDTVLMLGDMQYERSTSEDLAVGYDPAWGSFKEITHPVAGGSHDFYGGDDWAVYWGAQGGVANENWYSFELGSWHIVVLNSYCSKNDNCADQRAWLEADLAAHSNDCTLAAWHQPRYSSGEMHGSYSDFDWAWDLLYSAGADVVLVGHEHNYERFAPIDANDQRDDTFGLREFVVGTGGRSHYDFAEILPLSEVHNNDTYGVIEMTLRDGGYDWSFVPVSNGGFTDSGSGSCHGAPPDIAAGFVDDNSQIDSGVAAAVIAPIAALVVGGRRPFRARSGPRATIVTQVSRVTGSIGQRLFR
jgi:hypothetical protein